MKSLACETNWMEKDDETKHSHQIMHFELSATLLIKEDSMKIIDECVSIGCSLSLSLCSYIYLYYG